ncbi:aminoglycoside phosphotransferase family protein [Burkholderia alba]|uniref:aminoglycoside phosphotransferase family protein n=1 Tax=Burkholderia alba TaxID=2683677 RepID=UPI002B061575|nr:aminoglycoside phosphotransferase family protein [Burkholderia alba]
MPNTIFERHVRRWRLRADGAPIFTHSSALLPVRVDGGAAMLKVARVDEERAGGALMAWWHGDGAARVLAHDGDALLLARAEGARSLFDMALSGDDDLASRTLCAVAARLHADRPGPPPPLTSLARWFAELDPAARQHGGLFRASADTARALLADPRDMAVLHGDLHHRNVLDFGEDGWLAIDPKGLSGERGFDFANILCNPELPIASDPARFARQVEVVAAAARLERRRLLQWTLAYAGLSAAWFIADGMAGKADLSVARMAFTELQ